MTPKKFHMIVHDVVTIALNVSIFILFYNIDTKMAINIAALYLLKILSSFLYTLEQKREDQEVMDEIDKILKSNKEE